MIFQAPKRRPGARAAVFSLAALLLFGAFPTTSALALDPFAPGSVSIAGGAAFVNTDQVTLTISPPADAANRIRLSDDGSTWAEMDWVATAPWSLTDPSVGGVPGDGLKTVTIEFGDGTDWSAPTTAEVTLDTQAPVLGPLTLRFADPTHNGWLIYGASSFDESMYAIKGHRVSLNGVDWGDWEVSDAFGEMIVDLRKLIVGGSWDTGERSAWLQVRDAAGNESNVVTGSITVPDWPLDDHSYAPTPMKMSIPRRAVTGELFTLRPIFPAGFKMPADALCRWMLTWGSASSVMGNPDQYFGNIEFERKASQGGCTEWTFTLPYSAPRLYAFQFSLMRDPYARPEIGGRVGIAELASTVFRADLGTTERRVLHSSIGITYLLPTTIATPDVGAPMTYRLYATDASSPPQTGMFWAYPTDCYLNPQFAQQGGTTFTFRPICSGPWVAGWTGWYHGWFMRNMYDPIADGRAPSVHVPTASLVSGRGFGTTPKVRLSWLATDSGSGVYQYQAQLSRNGGAYASLVLASRLARSVDRSLALTGHYRLRVRARDRAGNWSAWRYGTTFTVRSIQDSSSSIAWSTGWTVEHASTWSGATDRWATTAGASATLRFTGRGIGWVSSLGPDRGLAQISLDGKIYAYIDLRATSVVVKRIVFTRAWSTSAIHTITVRLLGTLSHPRGDVDAFLVLK